MEAGWRVVDEAGRPAPRLRVEFVASGETEETSVARVDAFGRVASPPDASPARVLDPLGLRVVAHRVRGRDLVVDRAEAFGWAVHGRPVSEGNDVALFKDDEMWGPMLDAVDSARAGVHLSQLLLFKDFTGHVGGGVRKALLEQLLDASGRGAQVRVLLNDNWIVPDSVDDVRRVCDGRDCIEVRSFPMTPNVLHAKVLVVDGREAFIIGPPFQQRYWDTSSHADEEPRRNDPRPLHDHTLRIRGPAVGEVDALFAHLWGRRGEPCDPCPAPKKAGDQTLQIVTTLPRGMLDDEGWHARSIRESYQRAFANAEDFVYLETQYFTSPSIVRAIASALEEKPELQVIVVVNESVDVPLYLAWQKRRVAELGHPDHPRLGFFTLRSPHSDPRRPTSIYVHAKLALADDAWLSVGTSNLDSLSLERGQEWGFEVESNIDVNAVLFDGIEGAPRTGIAAEARRRIWSEHLGDEGVWTTRRPEGGWLALWRKVAQANAKAIEEGTFPARGRVVPYEPTPSLLPLPEPPSPQKV